ncbi:MAG TPA: hypothetical protein VFA22_00280 [Stellaceae bacterium]|nr:hypothetical protein [Stellaceae bacterium]
MADYRCYLLDGIGAIRDVEVVTGADDARALAAARALLDRRPEYFGFELWQRDRRVHVEAALAS